MIVALIAEERMYTVSLPQKISGRYWISDKDENGYSRRLADIEGVQGKWLVHGSSLLALLDDTGTETDTVALENESRVINAFYRKDGLKVQIFIEPADENCQRYKKYCVGESCRLNIGRSSDNHIVFDNKYVSAHHACLILKDRKWSITDTQSSNGTFVNEYRIATRPLNTGDVVYIMGLKIVVGNGFFAVNNPNGCIVVSADGVSELIPQLPKAPDNNTPEAEKCEHFCRSPRICRSVIKGDVRVDAPPPRERLEEIPLALLLGPALTMGMTAVVMGAVAVLGIINEETELSSAIPTIIMSFSMLCGTLLWPLLAKKNEKKKKEEAENTRQKKYREYLDSVKNEIYSLGETQKTILFENSPDTAACKSRIINRERGLWERSSRHEDFLQLRLGIGNVPLNAEIKFPEKRFSVEDDLLQNEVRRLAETPKILEQAPITCSLLKNPIVGIVGEEKAATLFLKNLILQIVALHSYDDVKLVFLTDETKRNDWDFAKLLPHTWSENSDIRYYATNLDDAKSISLVLERIILERAEKREHKTQTGAHYIVIASDAATAEREGLFAKIQSSPKDIGFSCITTAPELIDLPKECSMVVELNGEKSSLYDRNDSTGSRTYFSAELDNSVDMHQIAEILANLVIDVDDGNFILPDMMTFLEMFGVGKTEHLNSLTRWYENSPVNSLQAPIGIGQDGTVFNLNLHEKAHGPHGLVAGMTGSGKSELIITFILSMAVNYHPDEVAFILIDYKGGGLAGAFENSASGIKLPHLAGTITNLDGSAVNRALISIQSELRRRQAIFNEAKQISGEGTIDIYKYQKMYRSGLVSKPIPHLFIVSDEFAELKAQQPEFMAQLISAARIGRSLGVHLILATQKPTGVVDDQIWSNSRFRVCLKVQERADSMEMLKRPDAAELKETGRFYLQVGFNELFEIGQSAWCGAPYKPSDRVEKKRDDSIEIIDELGRVLLETKKRDSSGKFAKITQVVSVVEYLSSLAKEESISERQLWLPQIPEMIYLDDLIKKYNWSANPFELEPIIGEYDDPFNQSQGLLTIPFSREGNALIYGISGSGKTTLLNTLLVGLLGSYTAEQLNVYILDMGEETLRIFADAPQVGDVLLSSDDEKIQNLFKMLQEEINNRKKLFADGDGSYENYCRNSDCPLPQMLVIIRNYASFAEQYELLDEMLIQITRDCSKYGIYFLVTANAANTIRYRVAQNFSHVYALQLNDTADYIGLFGGTGGVYPSKIKGRGIFKNSQVYEFQTAYFAQSAAQQDIRTFICSLSAERFASYARPVPSLPKRVTASFFRSDFSVSAVPIGVYKESLKPCTWNLEQSVVSVVLTQSPSEMGETVQGIVEQLSRMCKAVTVLDGANLLEESPNLEYSYLHGNFAGRIELLFNEMVRRNNTYKNAVTANETPEAYEPEYYVITGLKTIIDGLPEEGKDKFNTLIEKAEPSYNIRFVVCDSAKGMSEFTLTPWYKRHVNESNGVWVGDGIADQYIMKIGKITNSLYSEIPPHFGYIVKRGKPSLIKLIVGKQCREEADE